MGSNEKIRQKTSFFFQKEVTISNRPGFDKSNPASTSKIVFLLISQSVSSCLLLAYFIVAFSAQCNFEPLVISYDYDSYVYPLCGWTDRASSKIGWTMNMCPDARLGKLSYVWIVMLDTNMVLAVFQLFLNKNESGGDEKEWLPCGAVWLVSFPILPQFLSHSRQQAR